jgi:hypothetical protein
MVLIGIHVNENWHSMTEEAKSKYYLEARPNGRAFLLKEWLW